MVEKTYHLAPYLDPFGAYLLPQLFSNIQNDCLNVAPSVYLKIISFWGGGIKTVVLLQNTPLNMPSGIWHHYINIRSFLHVRGIEWQMYGIVHDRIQVELGWKMV